jgi:hypothetical protein
MFNIQQEDLEKKAIATFLAQMTLEGPQML